MASNSLRQSQLIEYNHAAAGHAGVLVDASGAFFIKPCKQSEIDFYQSVISHSQFAEYVPNFIGELHLGASTRAAQAAGALLLDGEASGRATASPSVASSALLDDAWTPSNGGRIQTDLAIVLENVAAKFTKPNILDVKLGARLWADDAPVEKRARLDKAAEETTSKPLGFRIAGMKVFQAPGRAGVQAVGDEGYKHYDKHYGRTFNVSNVREGFEEYFLVEAGTRASRTIRKVIRRFIEDLEGLAAVIEQEESRMYSASLLFVYEGDLRTLEDNFCKETEIIEAFEHECRDNKNGISLHDANGQGAIPISAVAAHSTPQGNSGLDDESSHDERDPEADEQDEGMVLPPLQCLKLIDFAHAKWTYGQGPDQNLLHGIRNVVKILDDLR